ncbi:Apextrin-like protein 2 [Plakobranchus ocellatus]|uniref:Apextrin-like protein 2 n=1 Tax=Plakobranchus ocellatus TaxID=259542 RepID=A0AAV3ZIH0_9GAST|nr:Apextrin-like protein 2 [Plakobranchus ocellatus]
MESGVISVLQLLLLLLATPIALTEIETVNLHFRMTPAVVDWSRHRRVDLSCKGTTERSWYSYETAPKISSLRIFKNDVSSWRLVAEITEVEPEKVYVKDTSIASHSGSLVRDYKDIGHLEVSWTLPSTEYLGQYKCHMSRFNAKQDGILTTMADLSVDSGLDAYAIFRVLKGDQDEVQEKFKNLEEKIMHYEQHLKSASDSELSRVDKELDNLESEMNATLAGQDKKLELLQEQMEVILVELEKNHSKKMAEMNSQLQSLLNRGFILLWPRGTYALPQPKNGCPTSGGVGFKAGWRRHHTESTDRNKDHVSEGNHLQQPVLFRESTQNYLYQRFCVKTDSVSLGPTWPKGSYCINKLGECPVLFEQGSIKWDDENKKGPSIIGGDVPDGVYSETSSTLYYCCRKDGLVDEPIDLPRSEPFYLYRYGGQCQQVAGMNVSAEFIHFDTENSNNEDETVDPHPDAQINDVTLHLCYYQQL